jgi:hypothetical protein
LAECAFFRDFRLDESLTVTVTVLRKPNPLIPNPLIPNPLIPNPLIPNPLIPRKTIRLERGQGQEGG